MRRVSVLLLACLLATSVGCSKFGSGGKGTSGQDPMGDGNIPMANAGSAELQDVNFAYDSSALNESSQSILQENSDWLKSNSASVVIEGHCDERGTEEYNLALGERRARSVFNYLRDLGVSSDKMSTISYGEEIPLDPGHNEAAWAKNRRAHFALNQ